MYFIRAAILIFSSLSWSGPSSFVHSLLSQCWTRLFLWFSNTVLEVENLRLEFWLEIKIPIQIDWFHYSLFWCHFRVPTGRFEKWFCNFRFLNSSMYFEAETLMLNATFGAIFKHCKHWTSVFYTNYYRLSFHHYL